MKKIIVILSLFTLLSCSFEKNNPYVEEGYIDLSEFNFSNNLELEGHWYFADGHENGNFTDWGRIKVPSPWSNDITDGTYYLSLNLPEDERWYALYIPNCNTSYKLTLNGETYSNGRVGERYKPTLKPRLFQIKASGHLEILINVTDRDTTHKGLISAPWFGTMDRIQTLFTSHYVIDALSIGALFLSGLFSLGIWIVERKNGKNNQHILAMISFWMVVRFLTDYNRTILLLIDNFIFHEKLTWVNIPIIVALFALYFRRIFEYRFYQKLNEVAIFLSAVYALLVLFGPVKLAYTLNVPYELAMVIPMIATIAVSLYDIFYGKKSHDSLYWMGVMVGGIIIFGGNTLFQFNNSVLNTRIYAALIVPFQTLFTYFPNRRIYVKDTQLFRHKNEIFMRISDALRTPLFGIIGKLDVIRNRETRDFTIDDLNDLDESARKLSEQIDYLLSVSRADVVNRRRDGRIKKTTIRPNIICIDDVQINRSIMTEQLKNAFRNAQVRDFESGKAALEYMDSNEVDLIFCDLIMPEMDGFDFTKTCRKRGYVAPLLIFSASMNKKNRKKAIALGADGYLEKPITMERLKELMITYL